MHRHEKTLRLVLRLVGGLMLLAWPAVLLPEGWMAASHRLLRLGEFPASPLVDYLTRSISALYGIHGGLLIVLATDVRRFVRVIRYVAAMNLVFGILVTGIDLHAGMPWFWTWGEGPPIVAVAVLLLWLLRSVEDQGDQAEASPDSKPSAKMTPQPPARR